MQVLIHEIPGLVIQALITFLVVRYYKTRLASPLDKYSTFGPRFWHGSVDALVLWPMSLLAVLVLATNPGPGIWILVLLAEISLSSAYIILMHAKYGQTLGKMACKVKVVDFRTEGPISVRQAVMRDGLPFLISLLILSTAAYGVLSGELNSEALVNDRVQVPAGFVTVGMIPLLWFIAEVVTMLTNEKRRALHDFIAGTVVIRTNLEPAAEPPPHAPKAVEGSVA